MGEVAFDELIIAGDSDYDILEEKYDIISLNDIVWVKVSKVIWKVKVIHIPFSNRREDSESLIIKWIDTRKE